ncbi:MAG TPA: 30S ribosomal protein S6 [Acidobacteriaceae bacterium]|jgi:small subunit ribosomal protein S6|nr:30S ribosomal protein S6 [Acidobacteriaceae bacterium]
MQRKYEVMYILRPDVVDEDIEKLTASLESTVTKGEGKVLATDKMGMRKLAYTVRKFNDGLYMLMTLEADGALIAELERRLRVTEQVIKFITVRMDEEEKRLAKIKQLRSTRVKQSALQQHAPAEVAPAAVAAPTAETTAPAAAPVATVDVATATPAAL